MKKQLKAKIAKAGINLKSSKDRAKEENLIENTSEIKGANKEWKLKKGGYTYICEII